VGVRADFVVDHEEFQLEVGYKTKPADSSQDGLGEYFCTFTRGPDGRVEGTNDLRSKGISSKRRFLETSLGKQELLIADQYFRSKFQVSLSSFFDKLGVFHFSSDRLRQSGVPTPNPVLAMPGDNLPALVDWLQGKHPKAWDGIVDSMREIMPGLQEIWTEPLPSKTRALYFSEEGVGRPWRIDEVSDGTIHALSMLVAAADPRTSALVIEEPESSLHPWIIHELAKKLRELSKDKSIFLTTQSPIVIDTLKPSEVWIVSRRKGKTEIRRLTELDKRVEKDWSEGKYGLSEFLDSGLIPRAVPGGRT
jgi:predicted ATPase